MANGFKRLIQAEPTAIISVARYAILVGIAFGLSISDEQMVILLGFVEVVLFAVNRSQVTPVATVDKQVAEQVFEQRIKDAVSRPEPPDVMHADPTPEEWATVQELRAERDRALVERGGS